MKVLLLTQVLPYPPDSGPKIKTLNVLKYLAQHHSVTLVSFVRGDQSKDVESLKPFCRAIYTVPMVRRPTQDAWALINSLVTGQPWMMARDDRAAMREQVDQLASQVKFDIVHADQLNMAQYAARVPGAFKVLDAHNALWVLYRRLWQTMDSGPKKWLLGRDWRLLKRYEGRICREFNAVLAVSEEDKAALEEAAGQPGEFTVIPIAIDTDWLQPVERHPDASHIISIGTMYWPPNIDGIEWFIREIFPLIRARRPEAVFDVIGARPPQTLLDLNREGTGINVTGYTPDLLPYQKGAAVFVVPLRAGGGMRVKILEALAQGIPMVSTSLGCEGIAVTPGKDILVADTPEEFARATLRLLDDRAIADLLAANGRKLIEEEYDYRKACQPIDKVYARYSQ